MKVLAEGIVGAVAIAFTVLLSPLLRPWYRRWGASDEEASRSFPGDEFVPRPKSELTMAINVRAPAEAIWPWFVQLGCQRGGWYSYDLLDNGGTPSADRILPEYQDLKVGGHRQGRAQGGLRLSCSCYPAGAGTRAGGHAGHTHRAACRSR